MVRGEKEKAAVLILSAACIIICVLTPVMGVSIADMGICSGCSLTARFAYSFFHASISHALINCWCLLSIAFIYRVSFGYLITAYIIAVIYPFGGDMPTVGLSAVCFALMGMVSFQTQKRLYFHAWVLSFIGASALLAAFLQDFISIAPPNNMLHIYSYICGIIIGILNTPLITHGR